MSDEKTTQDDTNRGTTEVKPDNQDGGKKTEITFSAEQQEFLNSLIAKAKREGRDQAAKEAEEARKKADQVAQEAKLKEQAEWQSLAEQHEAKAKELEPQVETLTGQVAKYQEVIEKMLTDKAKELGDKAKKALDNLPGSPDALAKLEWLNSNQELFIKADTPIVNPKKPSLILDQKKGEPPPIRVNF